MCIGGSPAYATPQRQESAFKDAPPVVMGKQEGVEKPKDTKKATEELKIKRQKEEGTYVNPNVQRTEELLMSSGGSSQRKQRNRLSNLNKARNKARVRKSNSRMSGSRSRGRR
tara:strand:+ start:1051 stop:1389 length:339 start_codon:yes stop_codon:yes gene_type:complete